MGNFQNGALGQAIHIGLERADAVAEFHGQHRQDAVHEVGRVSTLDGFLIHRAAGLDVVGNIGDVHGELPTMSSRLDPERVVVVLGVGGIDGDDELLAPILAAGDFRRFRIFRHSAGFGEHVFWKRGAQPEAVDHADDVHARIAGPTEDFDDAAARGGAGLPIFQIDDNELSGLGRGVANELDPSVNRLVLAIDPAEALVFLEHADEPAGATADNLLNLAASFLRRVRNEFLAGAELPFGAGFLDGNKHPVAIQRGAGVAARNVDAVERNDVDAGGEVRRAGQIREEKRMALRVEFQGSGESVAGLGPEHVGGFFSFLDQPLADEAFDGFPKLRSAVHRDGKMASQ